MPNLMLYLVAVAALTSAAALVAEQACASVGRPRRFVWLAALLVSFALPAYSILAARGSSDGVPLPARAGAATPAAAIESSTSHSSAATEPALDAALPLLHVSRPPFVDAWNAAHAARGARVDEFLTMLLIASSAAVVALYGVGLAALHRAARRWPRRRLAHGGEPVDVLVSERLGPAIFGLLRPRIVVPGWLLEAPHEQQALVLRHEREHAAAGDPLLLAAALLLVALAPWNPMLWWQLSRLRASIELDCDARVVGSGASPLEYSEALLAVRRRPVSAPLPAVALTEPVSRLESRIRALLSAPSRLRRAAALASSPLVIVALVVACTLTPPRLFAQDAGAGATTRDALTGMVEGGERIVILVDTSASMLDSTLINVLRRRSMSAEERSAAPKWQQVVGTVEQLAAQIARGTQVQIIGFAEQARTLIEGSGGQWVTVTDGRELEAAVQALRATAPSGPSSLAAAIDAVRALQPPPDNVYLLVDGLPTMGETRPDRDGVTGSERADHFYRAIRNVPLETPFNVLLFPLEGDPWAAPLYWELALRTGGALVTAPLATRTSALTPLDVPEDEYVVFIVDTSGSMQSYAWDRVQQQIRETLEVYPTVKGIQIMNDEGTYMFTSRRGEWMPDTPATRQAIIDGMRNWEDYSDSSPREGILAAIDTFHDPKDPKKISLYVYSDDFSRGSISAVVREIDARNTADEHGNRRVRIHGVAFPVFWQVYGQLHTAAGYAVLMREIAQRNGGRFVGLPLVNQPLPDNAPGGADTQAVR